MTREPVICPVCGETVWEWIETAQAVHCYQTGRGWKKHPKGEDMSEESRVAWPRLVESQTRLIEGQTAEIEKLKAERDAFKQASIDLAQVGIAERKALRDALNALNEAGELWRHAECCVTGTGCTHDSAADCADSLLAHARQLIRLSSGGPNDRPA